MSKMLIGVFGASGFGREVMPLVRESLQEDNSKIVFVDDAPRCYEINGHRTLTYSQFKNEEIVQKIIIIAIADSGLRERLEQQCLDDNIKLFSVAAKNAVVMDDVVIGEGSIISPFVTLTSNIRIGRSFHANIYSYVAHDCVIGNYVTFAPGVKCNGNVMIEDHAYIGTGAIIKQGNTDDPLTIGMGAIIGMGAVVTKNVEAGAIVVGNPARPLSRKD